MSHISHVEQLGAHKTELATTGEGYLLPILVLPTQPAIVIAPTSHLEL